MVDAGARGDILGPDGRNAIEALERRCDKAFHGIAERLKY